MGVLGGLLCLIAVPLAAILGVIGILVDTRKTYAIVATVLAGAWVIFFFVLPLVARFFF